jgi:hypothetical protein
MTGNKARFVDKVAIVLGVSNEDSIGGAAATAWICSDEAYMTGQNLQINGGLTLRRLPTMKELNLT